MRGVFANSNGKFRFFLFVFLAVVGLFAGGVAGLLAGTFFGGMSSFYALHTVQFISTVFTFLFPPLTFAYLCNADLYIRKVTDMRVFLLAVAMITVLSPLTDLCGALNQKMKLPEFLEPVERLMRQMEDQMATLTNMLLSKRGVIPLSVNLLVIGVLAGVAEELFFRGALLSLMRRKFKNPHIAIWITAFIFSAIHFQFYGFLPRMLLGGALGYMLYLSGSIWAPVVAHAFNNSVIVVGSYCGFIDSSPDGETWLFFPDKPYLDVLIAIAGLALFICFARLLKSVRRSA